MSKLALFCMQQILRLWSRVASKSGQSSFFSWDYRHKSSCPAMLGFIIKQTNKNDCKWTTNTSNGISEDLANLLQADVALLRPLLKGELQTSGDWLIFTKVVGTRMPSELRNPDSGMTRCHRKPAEQKSSWGNRSLAGAALSFLVLKESSSWRDPQKNSEKMLWENGINEERTNCKHGEGVNRRGRVRVQHQRNGWTRHSN